MPFLVVADRVKGEEAEPKDENMLSGQSAQVGCANRKVREFEWLWHIDSQVKSEEEGKIAFQEIDVVFSAGKAQVITGQEEPEWQGFIATGTGQGMYRPVPCISVKAKVGELRMVTVLCPASEGAGTVKEVIASEDCKEDEVTVRFMDGSSISFREDELIASLEKGSITL